jgi:hypothetical protein
LDDARKKRGRTITHPAGSGIKCNQMSSNVINAINWRKQNEIYSKTIYVDVHEMVDCQKAWEINRGLKHQKPTGKGFVKMGIVYYLGSITVLEKFW